MIRRKDRNVKPFGNLKAFVHPDKVELVIKPKSATLLEADGFQSVRERWTEAYDLRWNPHLLEGHKWWEYAGYNDDIRVTFRGRTSHLDDPRDWLSQPFPDALRLFTSGVEWSYIGFIRITSRTTDPQRYMDYLGEILADLEVLGIQTSPRELEIAANVPNSPQGRKFARLCRLSRDNPSDLVHFRQSTGRQPHSGPSRNGVREYSLSRTYQRFGDDNGDRFKRQNSGRKMLAVYYRKEVSDLDEIRVELRLGPRGCREFLRSKAYDDLLQDPNSPIPERDYQPKALCEMLNLIGSQEYLFRSRVLCERVDLDGLCRNNLKLGAIKNSLRALSTRGIRSRAVQVGVTSQEIPTEKVDMPPLKFVCPKVGSPLKGSLVSNTKSSTTNSKSIKLLTSTTLYQSHVPRPPLISTDDNLVPERVQPRNRGQKDNHVSGPDPPSKPSGRDVHRSHPTSGPDNEVNLPLVRERILTNTNTQTEEN